MNTARTPAFLMANLGIEVERLYIAEETQDETGFASAHSRATRIIGQLRAHPEMVGRLFEVDALEEAISSIGKDSFTIPRSQFLDYFLPFSERILV
jgi:hypothetical protein